MAQAAPRDANRAQEAAQWVSQITGMQQEGVVMEWLKDGVVLCELCNRIKPNTCKKYKKSKIAFVCRTNIQIFLEGCKSLGVPPQDCFESRDLYDGQRPDAVIQCIYSLSGAARNVNGFNGPFIGVAYAQRNSRNFSAEVLAKSRSAVPMWNRGDRENNLSSSHDSYGIITNPDVQHHTGVQSTWEKGSRQNDLSSAHDSYGIVTNPNVQHHTGVQSQWEQGSIQNDLSSAHDSYGIVTNPNVQHHTGVQSQWEQGSLETDISSGHDSRGVVVNKSQQVYRSNN